MSTENNHNSNNYQKQQTTNASKTLSLAQQRSSVLGSAADGGSDIRVIESDNNTVTSATNSNQNNSQHTDFLFRALSDYPLENLEQIIANKKQQAKLEADKREIQAKLDKVELEIEGLLTNKNSLVAKISELEAEDATLQFKLRELLKGGGKAISSSVVANANQQQQTTTAKEVAASPNVVSAPSNNVTPMGDFSVEDAASRPSATTTTNPTLPSHNSQATPTTTVVTTKETKLQTRGETITIPKDKLLGVLADLGLLA